jgi:DNA-binding CsgD family transcriptional regulator
MGLPYESAAVPAAILALPDDRPDDAVELLEPLWRDTSANGQLEQAAGLAIHLTEALVLQGAGARAVEVSSQALEMVQDLGETPGPSLYAAALARCLHGDLDLARQYAGEARAASLAAGDAVFLMQARYVLGTAALAARDLSVAVAVFRELRDDPYTDRIGDPGIYRWQADAVEAFVGAGALDEARALLSVAQRQAAATGRRSRIAAAGRAGALLLAAEGDLLQALAELDRSADVLAGLGLPVEHGRLALARAGVLRRLRRRAASRDAAVDAIRLLAVAPAWQEHAEEALTALGLGRNEDALTDVERRVAGLVADGLSNPEVARLLFMSSKTVEAHLSRVYRKLGVPGRAGLARALQGSSPMSAAGQGP